MNVYIITQTQAIKQNETLQSLVNQFCNKEDINVIDIQFQVTTSDIYCFIKYNKISSKNKYLKE